MDHAADAVLWIRPDGALFYANQAACRLYGYAYEELTSLSVFDLNPSFLASIMGKTRAAS